MSLDFRTALVTGGSRGIGRAIALDLAKAGYAVAVNYAGSEAKAKSVVETIISQGGRAIAVQADVAQADRVDALVQQVLAEFGRLDVLVNNAGITRDNLIMRLKEEDWDLVLDTNLKGVYLCCRAAAKVMIKQRYGRIISVSSVIGQQGNVGQSNYAAAKAGVVGLTKTLARELATRNITVNAVAPGYIQTDMTAGLPVARREDFLKAIPLGRFGQPEDVAKVVVFLASPGADYITGQTINVDGGMVMC